MALVVGLLLGAGVFSIWWSFWPQTGTSARRQRWRDRVHDALAQAGLGAVSIRVVLATCLATAGATGLAVLAVSQSPPIAACFAVIAGWAPIALVRMRARQRREQLRDLWPEVVDHLSSGIRAGLSLPEALSQLAYRGPEELRPAFGEFAEDYRASGRFIDSLARLKDRLADPVADRLIEALRLTREVGGSDLGRLLRTLSAFLREDARTRAELEARQSWTVNAARLAVAAPWIVLALLATRPEAVAAYNRPAGVLVLATGAAVSVVAYRLMVRLGRLPEEERVLR
ncbi:type II secretion system protein F [Kineosporiaceae bacterium SCSIO 59966]|nr:type II secretion system protein F [Kineosporiaceae bacterium SCSIO 59966]